MSQNINRPKVLIIRFSSIGDIVLCSPVVRLCKLQLNAEIHFLTKESYRSLLDQNPYIDKTYAFKENIKEVRKNLKSEAYTHIIDLHKNIRSFQVKSWLKGKKSSFKKLNFQKWLMVNFRINRLPNIHIVDRYIACAQKVLAISNDDEGLNFFIGKENEINLQNHFPNLKGPYAVIVLGATYQTKRIRKELVESITSKTDHSFVLIGGKEEEKIGDFISNQYQNVFNACGKFNITQSASIISQSEVVITGDTGMMHIAAALKKRVIAIWGNTIPEFGMGPYQTKYKNFEVGGLNCRPCSKLGSQKCPKGHFKCMVDQDVDAIRSTIK